MGQAKRHSYRRFFQFSVRTLALAATLLCVVLGGGLIWWRWPFEVEQTFVVMEDWDSRFRRREAAPDDFHGPSLFKEGGRTRNKVGGCKEVYRVYRHLRGLSVEHVRHGPATVFDALGNKLREDHWSHGKLEGKFTEWNADGTVLAEGQYRNGRRHGDWVWHTIAYSGRGPPIRKKLVSYRDGTVLRGITHTDRDLTTDEWQWNENGVKKKHVRKLHTGQLMEEYTFCGILVLDGGEQVQQYLRDGPWRRWYASGQEREQLMFDRGRRVDGAKGWHANGQPWYQGVWKDDLEHGRWTWWHEEGTVAYQAEFRDGRLLRPNGTFLPDFQPQSEAEREQSRHVLRVLGEPAYFEFHQVPLPDVLKFICDLFAGYFPGLTITPDLRVLKEAGIDLRRILISEKWGPLPERFDATSREGDGMSLRAALQIMLQPHDLAFVVRNNQIVVTTRAEAEQLAKETP